MTKYEKQFVALKYFLLGRNYFLALKALEFARQHHRGTRKDQVTPEFAHQISICLYLTTLKNLIDEETTIVCGLLHDIIEDAEISQEELETKFGKKVADCVWLLTKKYKDQKKDQKTYFEEISKCPVASLVKGADRIHNVQTMLGVFSKEKQLRYLEEVEQFFLPMIKKAKYAYPEQAPAYFNIQLLLGSQKEIYLALLKGN